ncbi:hypothetical protein ONE63_001194 [Megalurothrips usitatus]|uniref:Kazal-like domain-containing protein n=1 Tax=Megalurothrips usitatus TaxID=439358 RepID=A0AAV7XCD7_9NEOP|nr:hypothetical protein ONE63_001194 [Megalurothrips usitatus]
MKSVSTALVFCAAIAFAASAAAPEEAAVQEQQQAAVQAAAVQHDQGYRCPDVCTAQFAPVCAVLNGRYMTFGNDCELTVRNCKKGEGWVKVSDTECGSPY